MSWWVVALAAAVPWALVVIRPLATVRQAGNWAIWWVGAGLMGAILFPALARILRLQGASAAEVAWIQIPAVSSLFLMLSALLLLLVAAWQGERRDAR